jgi:hypothetical protein
MPAVDASSADALLRSAEAAFMAGIGACATAAGEAELDPIEGMASITTGALVALLRLSARFGPFATPEAMRDFLCQAIANLAEEAWKAERNPQ